MVSIRYAKLQKENRELKRLLREAELKYRPRLKMADEEMRIAVKNRSVYLDDRKRKRFARWLAKSRFVRLTETIFRAVRHILLFSRIFRYIGIFLTVIETGVALVLAYTVGIVLLPLLAASALFLTARFHATMFRYKKILYPRLCDRRVVVLFRHKPETSYFLKTVKSLSVDYFVLVVDTAEKSQKCRLCKKRGGWFVSERTFRHMKKKILLLSQEVYAVF